MSPQNTPEQSWSSSDTEKWRSLSVIWLHISETFGSWITSTPPYIKSIRFSLHPQSNSDITPREHQASMGLTKCMYRHQVKCWNSAVEALCLPMADMLLNDIFPFIWISCDGQELYKLLRQYIFLLKFEWIKNFKVTYLPQWHWCKKSLHWKPIRKVSFSKCWTAEVALCPVG